MIKPSILFICTGNICRSPTAEAVFRHLIRQQGREGDFLIDSAGTHGYHEGQPPDPRALRVAAVRGVVMDDLRARQFNTEDFQSFSHIVAMDEGHYAFLQRQLVTLKTQAEPMLCRLMDYAPQADCRDVPDPYYGAMSDFEYALYLVEQGVGGLLASFAAGNE